MRENEELERELVKEIFLCGRRWEKSKIKHVK